ncbi:MAG: carboxylate-amine ligase [Sphingobacteriales bacterium]|nr:MAG: carboxylate-amine ligase [Sphingobacteriales bacterium]
MQFHSSAFPFPAGSQEELATFKRLQANFAPQFEAVFPQHHAEKTVVVVPSLTLDQEILSKVKGHVYYEERLLCLMLLLRMPNTRLVYITSMPVDPVIIDYYLHLLPGITSYHARQRLTLLSCYDASPRSLTEKIIERPRLLHRIRQCIPENHTAHLACFNVTPLERTLAVQLGIPVYGTDPDLCHLGSKSRSREIFRECGIPVPDGMENLRDEQDVIQALAALKRRNPDLQKAVIKMDEGFSGEGNAIFSFQQSPVISNLESWIRSSIHTLRCVADDLKYEQFMEKFTSMKGIVEAFLDGTVKTSPSVQCRINPLGRVDVLSTHDQALGGESGQVFLGARFPATDAYCKDIGVMGQTIAHRLADLGALGRFSIDFLSIKEQDTWKHYAIEINLRKGGTTHPYLMLQFLTDGEYNASTGRYDMPNGQTRCYYATDNLKSERYRGLTPHDLIEIAICNDLHYDSATQEGVMFHLIGALSQYGKLGVVCIGKDGETVDRIYDRTVRVLEESVV